MKQLFGFVLLAGLALALVDEQTPSGVVQESKKTDLIISANGQTIKINTDAGHRKAVGGSAARFRLNSKFIRVKTRKAQEETQNPPEEVGEEGGQDNQNAAETADLDQELQDLAAVINNLSELRSANPTADAAIEIDAGQVDKILDLLENYEKILTEASNGSNAAPAQPDPQEQARIRARRQQTRAPVWKHRPAFIKRPTVAVPKKGFVRKWFVKP